jgi:glycosyltransferase involved in cell wall biosynthesis
VRRELGVGSEALLLHSSNLRAFKRIDLLLECAARIRPRDSFKLLVLAGADFSPFMADVHRFGLGDRVIVREHVSEIEDYLQAADIGLFTSDMESFCLSILEAMCFGCPSVAAAVGGIPEVVVSGSSGLLVPPGNADGFARAVESLIGDSARRAALGAAARLRARELFSADAILARYIGLYRRVCSAGPLP